ncbi:capsule biosynthesis GfcC D2 domain-containing protein [Chania multitudinisentens]|uniref:capsule biosynthesis GfcC D2 domain-containing protein n=1 Tax=Chania multitudinisentens TaxID=1639108 RepID=UPI0004BB1355|nr:capsule biosynthesis GfcC D2 domain-containing protein [Chania multitudinisentens]
MTLENVPTLESLVVNNPALQGKIWWQGAAIAKPDANRLQQQKQQQLLARLTSLSTLLRQEGESSLAATVENVHAQLAELKVVGRLFVPLDPDMIQLDPVLDRRLLGEYQVYVTPEPSNVRLLGALAPHGKRNFLPGKDVSYYLSEVQPLDGAEHDIAWIITPQGESQRVPIAYWNRLHNEMTPGSLLFLGFAASALPEDFKDINEQIISLLTHRIPD